MPVLLISNLSYSFYEDRTSSRISNNLHCLVKSDISKALELTRSGRLDYVYISFPLLAEQRIVSPLKKFANCSAKLHLVSALNIDSLLNAQGKQIG